MTPRRTANTKLRALLRQVGWTGQRLANAVNTAGAENGLTLRYDRTSVAHWLSGTRPSPVVAALVAEVLARRLGRAVDVSETGLAKAPEPVGGTEDVAAHLIRLSNAESGTRSGMVYTTVDLAPLGMAELAATTSAPAVRSQERVGTAQTRSATLMLSVFSDSDFAFGSGRALPALSAYLATDVVAWLRASVTPSARARLYSAAARLTYLAGWMCFDANRHGIGQRYYRAAGQLAVVGGDTSCYAAALRGLSVQAHYLGHHAHALSLAEAATAESRHVPDIEAAFLAGQLAVAEAACGHHDVARVHLTKAERILDRTSACSTAVGGYHAAALFHQRAEALASSGDRDAAIRALTASLRCRPPTERRAHAITSARLAGLYLDTGRVDRACSAWATLLDHRPHLSSGRVEKAVRSMRARLRPHARHPGAQALIRRASAQQKPSW